MTCFTGAEIYLPAEGLNGFYVNPKGTGTLYIEDVTVSRVSEAQPETGVEVTELTMTDGKALALISNYTKDLTPSVFAVDLSQAPYEIKMASAMVPSLYNNVMLETETLSSGQGKAIARTTCAPCARAARWKTFQVGL